MNTLISKTQQEILSIYYDLRMSFDSKSSQELEDLRHRADEIRNNSKHDWSERTAAEMIYTAANDKLGL